MTPHHHAKRSGETSLGLLSSGDSDSDEHHHSHHEPEEQPASSNATDEGIPASPHRATEKSSLLDDDL